jgi:hypothetical protein
MTPVSSVEVRPVDGLATGFVDRLDVRPVDDAPEVEPEADPEAAPAGGASRR